MRSCWMTSASDNSQTLQECSDTLFQAIYMLSMDGSIHCVDYFPSCILTTFLKCLLPLLFSFKNKKNSSSLNIYTGQMDLKVCFTDI